MNVLFDLLVKEPVRVSDLERMYGAYAGRPEFVDEVIRAFRQLDPDIAWRAAWLLRRHARIHGLQEHELMRLIQCADEQEHWIARLNLCQLFAATGCPARARETLFPFLADCFRDRRTIVRAWALSALMAFRGEQAYARIVADMVRRARQDRAASMQARLRHLERMQRRVLTGA